MSVRPWAAALRVQVLRNLYRRLLLDYVRARHRGGDVDDAGVHPAADEDDALWLRSSFPVHSPHLLESADGAGGGGGRAGASELSGPAGRVVIEKQHSTDHVFRRTESRVCMSISIHLP